MNSTSVKSGAVRWHRDPQVIPWRYIVIVLMVAACGLWLALQVGPTTFPSLDLDTYQSAGHGLTEAGDPYRRNHISGVETQYRYPPLLAMLMPVLGWPPVWYALLGLATLVPLWIGRRERGEAGLLLPLALTGLWGQQLINGNAQAIVIALLAIVPFHRRAGAVGLAIATMIKVHPAVAALWYVGKRDWVALKWFIGACLVLILIQAPYLPPFFDYLNDLETNDLPVGLSLRALGVVPWVIICAGLSWIAYRKSLKRDGWGWMVLLQLVTLPRLLLVNIVLLLAAPGRIEIDPAPLTRNGSTRPTK